MKSKFLKPTLGAVCAMAFFIMSFTSVNASQVVSENDVTVNNSDAFANYDADVSDWWVLASSNWALVGPN